MAENNEALEVINAIREGVKDGLYPPAIGRVMEDNCKYFFDHKDELQSQYPGEWIAVLGAGAEHLTDVSVEPLRLQLAARPDRGEGAFIEQPSTPEGQAEFIKLHQAGRPQYNVRQQTSETTQHP